MSLWEWLGSSPFVKDMARAFDIFGAFNEPSPYEGKDPLQADAEAIAADFAAVFGDLNAAMGWAAPCSAAGVEEAETPRSRRATS